MGRFKYNIQSNKRFTKFRSFTAGSRLVWSRGKAISNKGISTKAYTGVKKLQYPKKVIPTIAESGIVKAVRYFRSLKNCVLTKIYSNIPVLGVSWG